MKLILVGDELERSHTYDVKLEWFKFALLGLGFLVFALVISLYFLWEKSARLNETQAQLDQLHQELMYEQHQLNSFYTYTEAVFDEHAKQAGSLHARLVRLEALGSQLAEMGGFDEEFDFASPPALGGLSNAEDEESLSQVDILAVIADLESRLLYREQELEAIESLLQNKQMNQDKYVQGKPVSSGWLSSYFGKRIDPFTGKVAWHNGVDFAGEKGTEILAVASGVVVWSGDRYGYGLMVELDHGNGYVTRYAHNEENLVSVGDVVEKGQAIAKMGSSGRSTGPHVHFEVVKNGKPVDPRKYVYR